MTEMNQPFTDQHHGDIHKILTNFRVALLEYLPGSGSDRGQGKFSFYIEVEIIEICENIVTKWFNNWVSSQKEKYENIKKLEKDLEMEKERQKRRSR